MHTVHQSLFGEGVGNIDQVTSFQKIAADKTPINGNIKV